MVGRLQHLSKRHAEQRADELLERFDLTDAASRLVKTFSGGMRRRLDLAASLVAAPTVLFLDEPTTGLDPRSRGDLWEMLRDLVRNGTTIVLTTQYLEEADQLADEIIVLDHGRTVAQGSPDELKSSIGTDRVDVIGPVARRHARGRRRDAAVRVQRGNVRRRSPDHHDLRGRGHAPDGGHARARRARASTPST